MNSDERGPQEGTGIVKRRQECDKPHRAVKALPCSRPLLFLIVRGKARSLCLPDQAPALPGCCARPLSQAPPPPFHPQQDCCAPLSGSLGPALQCCEQAFPRLIETVFFLLLRSLFLVINFAGLGQAGCAVSVGKHCIRKHTSWLKKAAETMVPCPRSKPNGHLL